MTARARSLLLTLAALVLAAGLVADSGPGRAQAQQTDQGVLAGLISRLLSTPTSRVTIGAVEGALSSRATIRDIRIADREGVWLALDEARLDWSRAALLRGRLQVDVLRLGRLEVRRRPLPDENQAAVDQGPILPELPVKVVVKEFGLNELALAEPVIGTAARLRASGSAELGNPSEGLNLVFRTERLDAPGRLALDLAYVPQTTRLRLALDHDEPAGGIAARLLDLPGLPPVTLKLDGEGPLDAFEARLDFAAGPTIGAAGRGTLTRTGPARRLALDLKARLEGLLPPAVAPVFQGETALVGDVELRDDGGVRLDRFQIASQTASLVVAGSVGAGATVGERPLDLRVTARALPTESGRTRAAGADIERLVLDVTAKGPLAAPAVNGTVDAARVRLPQGSLDRLQAKLSMTPVPAGGFELALDADATGVAPADRAIAQAIGNRVSVDAKGRVDPEGVLAVEGARVATGTAEASFSGRVGSAVLDGTLKARVPSLAPFSGVARLTGDPSRSTFSAMLDAALANPATGLPALDGLLGAKATASGTVTRIPDGFSLGDFRINGAHAALRLDGRATQSAADLGLTLTLPELRRADPRIEAGRAEARARLTGSLERPDATATVELTGVRALGRPIPRLALDLDARDILGSLVANLTLKGEVAGKPANGTARLLRPGADAPYTLDPLDVTIGSVRLDGRLAARPDGLAEGQVSLRARSLDDLSPLVLTKLAGSLDADVRLSVEGGRQNAAATVNGARLSAAGVTLRDLAADVSAADLFGRPVVDGTVQASELTAGGQTFRSVRLASEGTPEASRFTASAQAQGFDLDAAGRLVPGDVNRLELATFQARRGGRRIALAQPAALAFRGGEVTIESLVVAVEGGRLSAQGRAGERLDLALDIRALPLSAAEIFVPGLGLSGTLQGTATVTGTPADPAGRYDLSLSRIVAPQTRQAGVPPIDVTARGTLGDGRATVDGVVNAGRVGTLNVSGSVPLDAAGALDLAVRGRIDASAANTVLSAAGRRAEGQANLALTLRGTAADPRVEGAVTVSGGSFSDELAGIRLNQIEARLAARGNVIAVERLTAATPNGGSLGVSGQVIIDPAAGFPANLRITGTNAQLVSSPVVTATVNLALEVTGPVLRGPLVAGRVAIVSMNVSIPERLGGASRPLPETRHVRPPRQTQARLAQERRNREAASRRGGMATPVRLDLAISAQNRIFVRGRGLNAELGGDLRLQGSVQDPVAIGAFSLRRGRFDLLGQRIDLVRGELAFTGDLSPSLDFLAQTQAGDTTARIAVTGTASQPEVTLSSTPDLPNDEILSRLLFQRASGGLSAVQALQLAQAVSQLSGGGSGPDVFDSLRRGLGVDSLDITTGTGGGIGVGVGRYITDNVRVGVRAGARPEDSGVTVDIDVTKRLRIQGGVGAGGDTSLGVGAEWEY